MCCSLFSSDAQDFVAHRGASHDAPENTLAAFRLAWEQGADAIEGDFRLSADGHIVCIHDETTGRTGDRDINVARSSFESLRKVEVGAWKGAEWKGERIPELDEVLDLVPDGKRLFLEVKCGVEIVEKLVPELKARKSYAKKIVIICFEEAVIAAVREKLPECKAMWLCAYKEKGVRKADKTIQWTPGHESVLATLKKCRASGLDSQANLDVLTPGFVKKLRKRNLEFHAWTINDLATARRLKDLGVDSLTTDRPEWLRERLSPIE